MSAAPEDRVLLCADCGGSFVWTAGEQEYFAGMGLTEPPARCKECRQAKKARRGDGERDGGGSK